MASRRKKKRTRPQQDQEQNAPISRKDRNAEIRMQDQYDDISDYDDDRYDDDYDESVYGDVDRDYRDDRDTDMQPEEAYSDPIPDTSLEEKSDVVDVTTDSAPPPLPKHESQQQDFSGPHIKFPPNAKRKVSAPSDASGEKKGKNTLDADHPKKRPHFLKFFGKKDKTSDVEAASDTKSAASDKPKKTPEETEPKAEKPSRKSWFKRPAKSLESKSKPEQPIETDDDMEEAAPKRRWRFRIFWALFALAFFVWALPMIVTKTPLLGMVLSMATSDLNGTAQVKSASCGWFSGISVEGIDIKDKQGNTVIEVPAVEGDRSLLGLLWNSSNLGHFRLDKPIVHVVLGADGSTNVEELIAKYLEGPSGDPMDLGIEVVDAKVTVSAAEPTAPKDKKKPSPLLTLSGVDASVEMLADPNAEVSTSVKVSGNVDDVTKKTPKPVTGKTKPSRFEAELDLGRKNRLALQAQQILFDHFTPLLARVTSGLELQGSMTGKVDCFWGEVPVDSKLAADKSKTKSTKASSDDLQIKANAQLDNFSATGGPLGTDRLALTQPKLACQLTSKDGVYVLRQANLDSELATLKLDGQVVLDLQSSESGSATKKSTSAKSSAKQTFNLVGHVDLVRLADMLPTTLHLHDQTKVSSGELTLNVSASEGKSPDLAPLASGQTPLVWNAHIQTSDLIAIRQGHQLEWHQPITVTVQAHEADEGAAVVDHLVCMSNFLRIEAEGNIQECNAAASFDLNKLMNQLGAFVDLGGLQMRGQGWANLNWRRMPESSSTLANNATSGKKEGFVLDGDCQLRDLEISVAQPNVEDLVPIGNPTLASSGSLFKQPWRESRLVMILSATGRMPKDGPLSLSTAKLQINSDTGQTPNAAYGQTSGQFNEQIVAYLTAPVKEVSAKTVWPIAVNARGQLGRWTERMHAFGVASDWFAQGAYDAQLGGNYHTDNLKFDNAVVKVSYLQVDGPSVNFKEPHVELALSGHYDTPKSRLLVTQAKCQTSAAVLTGEDVIIGTPSDKPLELAGVLGVEGDMAKMQQWIADPQQPSQWSCQGVLKGTANLKQIDGVVSGRVEATTQHLQLSDQSGHRFYEPNLNVIADGKYDNASRVVEFTRAQLTSSAVSGQVKGKLISGDEPMKSDFAGSMECNMQRLSELLVPYLGPTVAFQGTSKSDLKLAGPMTLERLHAKAGIGWDTAQIYGFNLGKQQLNFTLTDGVVSSSPIQMGLSGGKVNVAPHLRVAPGAMQFEVQPGVILENVEVNPQMCEGGLKYIAPVLADVATANGRFSIAIDQCRLPIDDPGSGELVGRFMVHSMTVGAGPLLQQFTPLLKNAGTPAELQKESVVTFWMNDRRVYHKGLELVFPDITIKTHGYVGLDESLDLIAEMPVPPKWIEQTGGSIKPALQDQKVMIPIAGTLSRPQLNQQQMQKAMQQFVGKAATNVLETEGRRFINQGLNQLLGPRN